MNLSNSAKDSEHVLYHERLFPGLGFISFLLFMTASLGIAFGKPYGTQIGWLTFALSTTILLSGVVLQSPRIRISENRIQVDLAVIDLEHVGRIEDLAPDKLIDSQKKSNSKSAFLVLRPGIKTSVILEIIDTNDPHPYWHFSSRNSAKISQILRELK